MTLLSGIFSYFSPSPSHAPSPIPSALPACKFTSLNDLESQLLEKMRTLTQVLHLSKPYPSSPHLVEMEQQAKMLERCLEMRKKGEKEATQRAYFDALPTFLKNEIYFTVWLAHGTPDCLNYGQMAIAKSLDPLFTINAPYVFPEGENLLEQYFHLWKAKVAQEKTREILLQLEHLRVMCDDPYVSPEHLLELFKKLPLSLQWKFHEAIYRLSPDRKEELEWGKRALEKEIGLLIKLKAVDHVISYFSAEQKKWVEQEESRLKCCFERLASRRDVTAKSLEIFYQRLPEALKKQLPAPPYFGQGVNYDLYRTLGAHVTATGTTFRVFAPNARALSVAIKHDTYDQRTLPLKKADKTGIWEVHAEGVKEGTTYEYLITPQNGKEFRKIDPFGFECREYSTPCFHHESVVANVDKFTWSDGAWMQKRRERTGSLSPLNIYEMHISSWKKPHGKIPSFHELAREVVAYCKEMAYTHVQLMGILSHPVEESWGYQVTGFFSPNHRLGQMEDFQKFVDHLHQNGIGIILDWPGAHFANDYFGLTQFDGSSLFESSNHELRAHPNWGTIIFNYDNRFVREFLISNIYFWLDKMHIDGIRCDAVSCMIYRDYDRTNFAELSERKAENLNANALRMLQEMNAIVHTHFPGVITIAEESSGYPMITKPVQEGGLGFDLKVGFNWMHHCFQFLELKSMERPRHHAKLTQSIQGDDGEAVLLSLSHDEVSQGKKSLLNKCSAPDNSSQKFAELRLRFSYMFTLPGHKLSFMGNEFAHSEEWSARMLKGWDLNWNEHTNPSHMGVKKCVKALHQLYLTYPALWGQTLSPATFRWIDNHDSTNNVISYQRRTASGTHLLCVNNFNLNHLKQYTLWFPWEEKTLHHVSSLKEIFNSDHRDFGGLGRTHRPIVVLTGDNGNSVGCHFELPPLTTILFEIT